MYRFLTPLLLLGRAVAGAISSLGGGAATDGDCFSPLCSLALWLVVRAQNSSAINNIALLWI